MSLSKFLLITFLITQFGDQKIIYANNLLANQCAQLFDVKKQKPSFKDMINQAVRLQQEAYAKANDQQRAEQDKLKEEQERDIKAALDPFNQARKILFHEIAPRGFHMGDKEVYTEITQAYGIMDAKMTQMMYAHLMMAIGAKDIKHIFPSHYTDGPNSIMYDYDGTQVPMRPDDPVTNVSYEDVEKILLPKLNELSKSEDPNIQSLLKKIIPNHQQGDVYDFVTEAQIENVMKLAKTADGDTIDAMIEREDHEKLKKYVVYDQNSNSNTGTYPEASLLPLFIDGKPIYLQGNVWEWTKDHWDGSSPLIGGKDPLSTTGSVRSVRGACWGSEAVDLRAAKRGYDRPGERYKGLGFRLSRRSRTANLSPL